MRDTLFIDVNGVLDIGLGLDPELIENLCKFVKRRNLDLVLSSSWRKHSRLKRSLEDALAAHGVIMAGATPILIKNDPQLDSQYFHLGDTIRASEIIVWIHQNNKTSHSWVAVDDRPLALPPDNFVLVKNTGLDQLVLEEIENKLVTQKKLNTIKNRLDLTSR